jgi:amino acid adenylation domain-containing protein
LYVGEKLGRVGLFLVYNTDLFTRERMAAFIGQFSSLLRQIMEMPDEPITHYSLVTDQAKAMLPNPTVPLDDTWHGPVHEALAQHAHKIPRQTAVIDSNSTWSYEALNRRSNQLAHALIAQGIQPQDVVAIYGHRSASLVWALMGVFKAGAAFLILDPAYPASRLADYLKLAQPKAFIQVAAAGTPPPLITETLAEVNCRISLSLPALAQADNVETVSSQPTTNPAVRVGRDDMALLAFTSGSTGQPKGIRGRHGSLTHFLPWIAKEFGLSDADRFSMLSGLSHDPLQRDIFTALWTGGTLCIPDPQQMMTPGWAANWLREQQVTFANLTPAMSQLITTFGAHEETAVSPIPSLRYAFFIGEVLTRQDVNDLRRLCPGITAVNLYGTTETQRALSYHIVPPEADEKGRLLKDIIPLGRGMAGSQLLLLNKAGNIAGVGEVAEICFRSPHLALGYHNDPAQTADSFRPNPFGAVDALDRVYLTGDMGRYLPNGEVAFANRIDQQVNIRGFRVELSEIEGALMRHPQVQQAIVMVREDAPGGRQLAAYLVTTNEHSDSAAPSALSPTELRDYLNHQLPAHMVPSIFMFIDKVPLTPNGKIDYRTLPKPEINRDFLSRQFVAPRHEVEEIVAIIFADSLHLEKISVTDNFFELGGHSLLVTQILFRLMDSFQIEFSLQNFFEDPTVAGVSRRILSSNKSQEARIKRTAQLLIKLSQMSDEEVAHMLQSRQ